MRGERERGRERERIQAGRCREKGGGAFKFGHLGLGAAGDVSRPSNAQGLKLRRET